MSRASIGPIAGLCLVTATAHGVGFNFVALPPVLFPNNHFPTNLAAADFNGDGHPDIVVPGRDVDGLAYLLFNTGNGTLGQPVPLIVGGQTDWVQVGDIDGDGILDLVFAFRNRPSGISVMRGMGGGAFHPVEHFKAGRELRSVALRDFDGDGDLDVAGVDYSGFQVLLWSNDGSGNFVVTFVERLNEDYFGLVYPGSLVAGDLTGDGRDDLVATSTGAGRVNVLVNRGDGSFSPEVGHRPPVIQGTLPGLTNSALGDMDGDGDLDIVTPYIMGFTEQRMGVLLNDAAQGSPGTFSGPVYFAAAPFGVSWWASPGDFDGDGDLDLATGHGLPGTFGLMSNFAAQGEFFLFQVQTVEMGQFVRCILPVDLDSDGDLDLVLVEAPSNQVIVLRNDTPQVGGSNDGGVAGGPGAATAALARGDASGTKTGGEATTGQPPGRAAPEQRTVDHNGDAVVDGADLGIELANLRPDSAPAPDKGAMSPNSSAGRNRTSSGFGGGR